MFKYAVKLQFLTMVDCMLPICNIFCFILFIYTLRGEATFSLCELACEKQPLPTTVQFSIVHARNSKLFRYFDKIMVVNVKAIFTIIVKFQRGAKGLFNNSIVVFMQKIQYVMKDVFVNTVEPRYFELGYFEVPAISNSSFFPYTLNQPRYFELVKNRVRT